MSNPRNTEAAELIPCPKCEGSGKVSGHSHYTGRVTFTGKCFECDGTKTITRARADVSEWAKSRAGLIYHTLSIVMEAASGGDDERAEFYLNRAVAPMFMIGKRNARKVLAHLATGAWHYDSDGTRGTLPQATAHALRDRLIELGKAHRAALAD